MYLRTPFIEYMYIFKYLVFYGITSKKYIYNEWINEFFFQMNSCSFQKHCQTKKQDRENTSVHEIKNKKHSWWDFFIFQKLQKTISLKVSNKTHTKKWNWWVLSSEKFFRKLYLSSILTSSHRTETFNGVILRHPWN